MKSINSVMNLVARLQPFITALFIKDLSLGGKPEKYPNLKETEILLRENPVINNSSTTHFLPYKHLYKECMCASVYMCMLKQVILKKGTGRQVTFSHWVRLSASQVGWDVRGSTQMKRPADMHTKACQLEEPRGSSSHIKWKWVVILFVLFIFTIRMSESSPVVVCLWVHEKTLTESLLWVT